MRWTDDGDALVRLLGRPSDDPALVQAMADFQIRWPPALEEPDPDEVDAEPSFYVWRPSSKLGFEFGFQDEAHLLAQPRSEWGSGRLILNQVCFYGQHEGVLPFVGRLPFGLSQHFSRAQVQHRMQAYGVHCRSHHRDVWDFDAFRVVIQHGAHERQLDSLLIKLRSHPWPPVPHAPLPTLAEILSRFGDAWHAPEMQRLFFPLGLDRCGPDIARHRWASLREDIGADLYFFREPGLDEHHPLKNKGGAFSSIKLYASRFQEARQWEGGLPCGLGFDLAFPELVRCVGRSPDGGQDDNLEGFAVWHFSDYSLHILYSNVDNQILCCTLFAPGALPNAASHERSMP